MVCDVATEAQTPSDSPSKGRKRESTSIKEQKVVPSKQSHKKNSLPIEKEKQGKRAKPSREERGYTEPRGKKYKKEDWMQFLHPDKPTKKSMKLKGEIPDFSEEGWARRKPKKK